MISGETKLACIYDEDLRIVDFSTGEQLDRLSEDSDADINEVVTCFWMHPNGDEVVVATQTFLLRHWKVSEKNCLRVIKGHTMPVLCMAYDRTGFKPLQKDCVNQKQTDNVLLTSVLQTVRNFNRHWICWPSSTSLGCRQRILHTQLQRTYRHCQNSILSSRSE